jgi:hypothetical protein
LRKVPGSLPDRRHDLAAEIRIGERRLTIYSQNGLDTDSLNLD